MQNNELNNQGGFNENNFSRLFESEEKSFWFNNRNRLIIYFLKKYFFDMKDYLEVGCGTGYVLNAVAKNFPCCRITGTELFEEGLKYAKQRNPQAVLFQLDIEKQEANNKYDVFGAFDVLEHIKQDENALGNLFNSLKETNETGGVITVPQHMCLWSVNDERACHVRRYSQRELKNKLVKAGFKIKRMTGFVSLLFPLMYISRLLKRKNVQDNDELHLPSFLNFIFSIVMKIEFLLIKIGVNFLFGGSIIAVVEKNDTI